MKTNKEYQRDWYNRQKNPGIVYLIEAGPYWYVGSTRGSVKKRLWQHKAQKRQRALAEALLQYPNATIRELERVSNSDELRACEVKWINELSPNLNLRDQEKLNF